tara:strand:- start:92 stop:1162 length:1071 start_codon:yes stop_codon:yes gene_type:complete
MGTGAEEDVKIVFDGNAKDFYIALDDSADKLVIGEGSTVGTNSILTITDDSVTIGDGAAVDTSLVFDGNAQDYYIGLDDSADNLIVGKGSTVGTTPIISVTGDQDFLVRQTSADVFDTNTGSTNRQFWGNQFSAANNTNSKVMIGSASNAGLIGGSTVNSGGTKFILNSYINFGSTNQTAGSEAGMVQFYTSTGGGIAAVRARIDSDGLKFGSDTAAASALDDYEEGEHNPTIAAGSGTPSIASAEDTISYTKIGNKVFINGQLGSCSASGCSGTLTLTMPFAGAAQSERADFYFGSASTNNNDVIMFILSNTGNTNVFDITVIEQDGTKNYSSAAFMSTRSPFDMNFTGFHYTTT